MKYDTRPRFQRLKTLMTRRRQDERLNDDFTLNDAAIRRMEFTNVQRRQSQR